MRADGRLALAAAGCLGGVASSSGERLSDRSWPGECRDGGFVSRGGRVQIVTTTGGAGVTTPVAVRMFSWLRPSEGGCAALHEIPELAMDVMVYSFARRAGCA